MLNLSTDRPNEATDQPFPIIRVGATKPLVVVITSPNPMGCWTHYWGGRTVPCDEPDCDACKAASSRRWHCYTSVWNPTSQQHSILELTAAATENLYRYYHEHGTLRHCQIECVRQPRQPNGRILLRTKLTDGSLLPIPEPPDVVLILARLWNIPLSDIRTPEVPQAIKPIKTATKHQS